MSVPPRYVLLNSTTGIIPSRYVLLNSTTGIRYKLPIPAEQLPIPLPTLTKLTSEDMYRVREEDVTAALYVLSPTGASVLIDHLTQRFGGTINLEVLHATLARLVDRGTVTARTVAGVTLWALVGC